MASPTNPLVSTGTSALDRILAAIIAIGGQFSVYGQVAGVAIPLIRVAISDIKGLFKPGVVLDYGTNLTNEQAILLGALIADAGDGVQINAELKRMGLPEMVFAQPPSPLV